jgi:hypothetical protein
MATIEKLIVTENAIKEQLKSTRDELKQALMQSPIYEHVLQQALETRGDIKVSEKTAAAHALKVARANYAKE